MTRFGFAVNDIARCAARKPGEGPREQTCVDVHGYGMPVVSGAMRVKTSVKMTILEQRHEQRPAESHQRIPIPQRQVPANDGPEKLQELTLLEYHLDQISAQSGKERGEPSRPTSYVVLFRFVMIGRSYYAMSDFPVASTAGEPFRSSPCVLLCHQRSHVGGAQRSLANFVESSSSR